MDPRLAELKKALEAKSAHTIRLYANQGDHSGIDYRVLLIQQAVDVVEEWLLASPVPPPSADARAKLERIVLEMHSAAAVQPPQGSFRAMIEGWRDTVAALLALPPHEGETPQGDTMNLRNANESTGWLQTEGPLTTAPRGETPRSGCIFCGEKHDGGYETPQGVGPFCSSCWSLLDEYFSQGTAHERIAEGETPQPAAETEVLRDALRKADESIVAGQACRSEGEFNRWRLTAWRPQADMMLPPVVQTRPEEPR